MIQDSKDTKRDVNWGRIQVALATGFCIVGLALVSKRVLDEAIRPAFLAIPALLMFLYELVSDRQDYRVFSGSALWVAAIFLATIIVVLLHVF